MTERYHVRRGPSGFSVIDIWTGETAMIALTPQVGLTQADADHTAELLNRRARQSDRALHH